MRKGLTVTVLRGIPGSGKTTWAKNRVNEIFKNGGKVVRISYDDLRESFHNTIRNKDNERLLLNIVRLLIPEALWQGYDVIVDGTHLNASYTENVRRAVADHNRRYGYNAKMEMEPVTQAVIEYVDFDTQLEVCLERNRNRPNPVPENVIRAMYKKTPSVFGAQALARTHAGEALDGP